jgi:hypothetical protein
MRRRGKLLGLGIPRAKHAKNAKFEESIYFLYVLCALCTGYCEILICAPLSRGDRQSQSIKEELNYGKRHH